MTSRTAAPTAGTARGTVLVGGAAWLATAATAATAWAGTWVWWLGPAVFGGAWLTARVLTRDIAERRADQVDEYELTQRQGARNLGYLWALAAAVVLYLLFVVATNLAERGDDRLLLHAPHLVLAAMLPAPALPTFGFRRASRAGGLPGARPSTTAALCAQAPGRRGQRVRRLRPPPHPRGLVQAANFLEGPAPGTPHFWKGRFQCEHLLGR